MNKQQAQQIIRDTFENSFDKNSFAGFIKNLLNRIEDAPFTYKGNYIPDAYKQYIKTLERIGKFSDGESSIDILVITLQKDTSLEHARTMQRNFIAWYLNGSRGGVMKDAALAAFVSPDEEDWRFSLVKMDYKFEKSKTGRIKVKEEFTPARRWSFLVGANEKSHTAQSRLVNILANDEQNPILEEIEKAFDIETVTKEFFLKYRELFLRTKEELDRVVKKDPKIEADFESNGVDTVNFAKKLLGQIIFLYFLQKKGWFGVGRDDDWGTGSKHFLRELFDKKHGDYKNFFNDILEPLFYEALRTGEDRKHEDYYYSRFNCKVPFLNGGLFDPIGNDGGYDWVHTDIKLPDKLFSNTEETKEGDTGDGILDIFDRYNFTVKEDEPLEKEVAIDPELLGKAYEKFNAIRPDNYDEFRKALKSGKTGEENKFNKKFGVYYTPREIVHYMCQQSLINYLATEVEGEDFHTIVSKEDIETLIHIGEQVSEHEARVMQEGRETQTYSHKLSENIRKNAKLIDDKLTEISVCDPAVGSGAFPVGMMHEIVRARNVLSTFIKDEKRTPYEFKRRCIEHSLYGVDIDPGAVEIAKLRLWLSLVVDEDDIKNIKPLPNLDYKIVRGNSLLGVEKDLFNAHLFSEMEKLKPLFFNETNPTKKQEYKNHIDKLISDITSGHTEFDFEVYFSEVFHNKGGFDVVIANPPYISNREMHKIGMQKLIQKWNQHYISAKSGNYDIYVIFIELGLRCLKKKGVLSYIIPNRFIIAKYSKALLELIKKEYLFESISDFSDCNIFESSSVYPVVIILCNTKGNTQTTTKYDMHYHFNMETGKAQKWDYINHTPIFPLSSKEGSLIKKIENVEKVNKNLSFSPGINGFQFANYGRCVTEGKKNEKSKRLIVTGVIDKFTVLRKPTKYKGRMFKKAFIYYDPSIISVGKWKLFNTPKILVAGMTKSIEAILDEHGEFAPGVSVYSIISDIKTLKCVLGIVNSKLIDWYFSVRFQDKHLAGGYISMNTKLLQKIPILNIKEEYKSIFIKKIDQIISVMKENNEYDTKALKAEIDQMVFKLYDLSEDEIAIVEENNR